MTKEKFDELYVGKNLVVNCKTEEDAKEFLAMAHEFGYKWSNGNDYISNTSWGDYAEKTYYRIYSGTYWCLDFCKLDDYTIVTYPAHKKQFTKADLADGFKVVYKNGSERYVLSISRIFHDKNGEVVTHFKCFEDDLTHKKFDEYNVMQVYNRQNNLVWKRNEKSPQQIEIERIESEMRKLADELAKLKEIN